MMHGTKPSKVIISTRLIHYRGVTFMFEINGIVYANEFKESLKLTDARVTED